MSLCILLIISGIVALIFGVGGTFVIPTPFGRYAIPLGGLLIIAGLIINLLGGCV